MTCVVFLGIVGVLILVLSGLYTVKQQTRAIIERFGRFQQIAGHDSSGNLRGAGAPRPQHG